MSPLPGSAEEALRASEARFSALFDRAPIGLALVDPHGRILSANTALQEILGYDEQELCQMTFAEITHPEDLAADWILFQELLAETRDTYSMDKRYLRRDGGIVWGHLAVSVTRDQDGTLLSMIGMLLDMSERHTSEERLRASEERYRQVERHAPIGLALQDPDGRYLRVNPALCALVGYTEEELLARTFGDITHPDDLGADLGQLRRMLAGEAATHQAEKRYVRKDGAPVWALISVSLVREEDGRPAYFIAQMQDIGARKEAERALEQSTAAAEELAAVRQQQAEEAEAMAAVGAALGSALDPATVYPIILAQAARVLPFDHAVIALYQDGWEVSGATLGGPDIPPQGSRWCRSTRPRAPGVP